jgi:hypothetical protein
MSCLCPSSMDTRLQKALLTAAVFLYAVFGFSVVSKSRCHNTRLIHFRAFSLRFSVSSAPNRPSTNHGRPTGRPQIPQSPSCTTTNDDENCSLHTDARDLYPSLPSITSAQQKTSTKFHNTTLILISIPVLTLVPYLHRNRSRSLYPLRPDGSVSILGRPVMIQKSQDSN